MENRTTAAPVGKPRNVAEYISWQIHISGRKQLDIAKEAGFEAPNVVTMIKQGKTKVPLDKIGKMAKALGVDPIFLFSMCMKEYMPDTWTSIEALLKQPALTSNEIDLLEIVRSANPFDPKVHTLKEREKLVNFAKNLRTEHELVEDEEDK